ncbi:uncharacterized protein PGTG_01910 [Puccinia graminis f. sp. tritici CRL 75-36-700-3]|uniref:Uncharacterized protein n=1 Tax=Puccinia graminis f. sp. tritici (strain CRL 75-36-700-3 / race SCCL) TaxID=418459 RepID=E3JTJ2_PUCGT|nr:uncharacterized protein PGTG_01910 [Puccinia graminis f. sp. tritici CRL 75-36-700-3]EFP75317.1 hypothetical protein PGTG_01910 [Puccinia graminis f. sp. tritici CRL 75-36-700-3]
MTAKPGLNAENPGVATPESSASRLTAQSNPACQNSPLGDETAAKRCKKSTQDKTKQNPSSKTSHLNPWEQSHGKPDNKDKRKNESNERRRTGYPISQPSGPLLLARINQDQNETSLLLSLSQIAFILSSVISVSATPSSNKPIAKKHERSVLLLE